MLPQSSSVVVMAWATYESVDRRHSRRHYAKMVDNLQTTRRPAYVLGRFQITADSGYLTLFDVEGMACDCRRKELRL